ncbi:dihydrofolate reductase family protein [Labedaea rhizosphaerae]|uniref:Dihydrofolate reductase n=1 Tax=Labedaea rhizosphaerae TaxID=598644 RepID=A0A4R6S8W5_LABRH|nr:dihydrofolate reductase family protein [Labedaea rhizosphaerae]TDP96342.1 dihydrofolate reductase [Labedaea rhizosphaerae]
MGKVVLDVTASVDGFTSGPNVRPEEPMGDRGELLHEWMGGEGADAEQFAELNASVGATVVGRTTFDLGLKNWGGTPYPGVPCFVVTHRPEEDFVGDNGGQFSFDGLEAAVRRAKEAAGDKVVYVLGADIGRQLLAAGLLDELSLHIAPVLLGGGARLFDGELAELVAEGDPVIGTALHQRYRVQR